MSRGELGNIINVEVAKNASTTMFDRIARWLWSEHGIVLFHHQDGRVPQEARDFFIRRWTLKYGRRA